MAQQHLKPDEIKAFAKERYGLSIDMRPDSHLLEEHSKEQMRSYLAKLYIDDSVYEDFMKEARFLLTREMLLDSQSKQYIHHFLFQLENGLISYSDNLILDYFVTFIKMGALFSKNPRRRLFLNQLHPYKDKTHPT